MAVVQSLVTAVNCEGLKLSFEAEKLEWSKLFAESRRVESIQQQLHLLFSSRLDFVLVIVELDKATDLENRSMRWLAQRMAF